MQGHSDAAIAKLLGKSRINIAVRLHRARAQVKKRLRDSLGEEL
jgi:DNA-directed RNA polymerase specialized sigma24 family protein